MDRRQSKILVVVEKFHRYVQEHGLCRDAHRSGPTRRSIDCRLPSLVLLRRGGLNPASPRPLCRIPETKPQLSPAHRGKRP